MAIQNIQSGINEAKRLAELAKMQAASDVAAGTAQTFQPGTTTPITGADLTPAQPIQIPPTPTEPNYQSIISAIPQIDLSSFQTSTKSEAQQDDLSKRILELTERLSGRGGAQAEAEKTAGIPQLKIQLTDITNQLQALQKEAAAIPLEIQQEFASRGVTAAGVAPIEAGRLRQNAIKALGLSAIGQTFQGNLSLARQQADRAVELEFAPIESQLKFIRTAYEMNKDLLEREDKKRAIALEISLNERERILQDAKDNKQKVYNISLQAAQNGADMTILDKIRNSRSPEEALSIGGFYLGAEFRQKIKQQEFEQDLQKATYGLSVDKFNEDIRQFNKEYALKEQELAIKKLTENAKMNPAGANVLKQTALESATELLRKLDAGEGTSAVGKSRILGLQYLPGTASKNFQVQFNNLKSLLSLDNVSLLKGQGQVSDAERRLLSEASAKLELSQSEPEFRKAILDIQKVLSGKLGVLNIFEQTLQGQSNQFYSPEEGYLIPTR